MKAVANQSHLALQNLDSLNLEEVNPLTPEIISRQATQNIGTIGHVAHGKSTLVLAVSGVSVSNGTFIHPVFWHKHTFFIYQPKSTFRHFRLLTCSFPLCRLFVIKRKRFVTSRLNLVTPMPNFTSVLGALILSATSRTGQSRRIRWFAKIQAAVLNCFSGATCPSSIAPVTMCSWPPCLQVQQSWTAPCCLSPATSRVRSRRLVSTWLPCRSWTWTK